MLHDPLDPTSCETASRPFTSLFPGREWQISRFGRVAIHWSEEKEETARSLTSCKLLNIIVYKKGFIVSYCQIEVYNSPKVQICKLCLYKFPSSEPAARCHVHPPVVVGKYDMNTRAWLTDFGHTWIFHGSYNISEGTSGIHHTLGLDIVLLARNLVLNMGTADHFFILAISYIVQNK